MNWTIRSRRSAPRALRTPTSTARRDARAVIRVTKLIAATSTISTPMTAIPASTFTSAPGFRSPEAVSRWIEVNGLSVNTSCRCSFGACSLMAGMIRLATKPGNSACISGPEAPGFRRI